jgi:hypothetical protein
LFEETSHEEQEAFWSGVITSAIDVSPVDQYILDPSESMGEFLTAAIRVEKSQDVHAHDRIKPLSSVIKVGLVELVT